MKISAGIPAEMLGEIPEGYKLLCDKTIKHPTLPVIGVFLYSKLTDEYLIRCEEKDYAIDYDVGKSLKLKKQRTKARAKFEREKTERITISFFKKNADVYKFLQSKKSTEGIAPFVIRLIRQEMSKEAQTPEKQS